ncbi:MAG: flagellar basal body rod protein FlgC [Phycisphaerae bacterium]|nr:flagellar basal body rod protein FlgC [Phycisphaerae bacterium]
MYGSLDISTSGMIAQRIRLTAIASNIANRGTVLDSEGRINPYRARQVMLAPGDPSARTPDGRALGVHVAEIALDATPIRPREFNPDSPLAYKDGPHAGYVAETNVNPVVEQVNALEASRAYEANVVAAEATKQMLAQALRLLA